MPAPVSWTEETLTTWRAAIAGARRTREDVEARYGWQANIDRYAPASLKETEGHVNVGADFADVERKKAALFFSSPSLALVCDEPTFALAPPSAPPQPGQPPVPPPPTLGTIALIHQELLNALVSDVHLGLKAIVGKAILDLLLAAGVGPVRVGYTAAFLPTEEPAQGAPPVPPVSIHEEFWVARVSPKALLLPAEHKDTDIRRAAWVGHEFVMPVSQLRAEYQIPEDTEIPTGMDKISFNDDRKDSRGRPVDPPATGVYLEYRALLTGESSHPKAVWCLVLIDGMDAPIKHGPSPHQTFGPDGRLTPDSLPDYTILPLWTRDLPDSAWVPSDCTITAPLTRELNTYRTQAITQRDSARQVILFDSELLDPVAADQIKQGEINTMVPVRSGALAQGAGAIMAQVVTASIGRENYLGQDYIQSDRDKIHGISANTTGANSAKATTATEATIVNRNTEARFNQEQARVQEWYLSVVRTLDLLVLRYADARLATTLLGARKGQLWAQFKQHLAGGYRYEIHTDSGKYMDAEAQRRQWLQFYQMTIQDPLANKKVIFSKLLAFWGIDPVEGIVEPQPAPVPPPQVGVSFKGEDFSPLSPQFPLVVKMAQQGGWQITPEDVTNATAQAQQMQQTAMMGALMAGPATAGDAQADMRHGGPAPQQMPLNKRQLGETGATNNAPGAM